MIRTLPIFIERELHVFAAELRVAAGLSTALSAAAALGVSRSNISRYETEKRKPPLGYLAVYARLIVEQQPDPETVAQIQSHLLREINHACDTLGESRITAWAMLCALAEDFLAQTARSAARRAVASEHMPLPAPSEAQLDLPRGAVPLPALLSVPHRLTLPPNPLFYGRDALLSQLAALLQPNAARVAISGIGGLGKTQLASEFAHRYGSFFSGGVFWLSFADPQTISQEVLACVQPGKFGLPYTVGHLPASERLTLIRGVWQRPIPMLLIFDDCADTALFADWCPPTGGARVLLTSRRAVWDRTLGITSVALAPLPRAESMKLLAAHRADALAEPASLQQIAQLVGDLPLALHLLGRHLGRYRYALAAADLLQELTTGAAMLLRHPALLCAGQSPTGHSELVEQTLLLSFARLDPAMPEGAAARTLLAIAAAATPGLPIPVVLLLSAIAPAEQPQAERRIAALALAALLDDTGLLELSTDDAVHMHPLVAAAVRLHMPDMGEQFEQVVLAATTEASEAGQVAPYLLVLHARSIADRDTARADAFQARLCRALGWQLVLQGWVADAMIYAAQALALSEVVFGAEHIETVRSANDYGLVLQAHSRPYEARAQYERAFDACHAYDQGMGLDSAMIANNLGRQLIMLSDFSAARGYFRLALRIRRRLLGWAATPTITVLGNRGHLHYHQGRPRAAQRAFRLALTLYTRQAQPNLRGLSNVQIWLSEALLATGDYQAAEEQLVQAAAILAQIYGDRLSIAHGIIAWLQGGVAHQAGERAQAERDYRTAIAITEQLGFPDAADSLRYVASLGQLYAEGGSYGAARGCLERAVAIWDQKRGPAYYARADALALLAAIDRAEGCVEAAERRATAALHIYQAAYGAHHPQARQLEQVLGTSDSPA